ncbi:serine hydrolase [Muricoccus radiodurans]|uniref:serine hydrolase n=1 Tax=Muricoccus radiodurans TaxID=2231721 RepID=UPI003CE712FC
MGKLDQVAAAIGGITAAQPFVTGWSLRDVTTGDTAGQRRDVPTPSASTRKILFLMAALRAVHSGRLRLDQRLVAGRHLMQGAPSGVLYYMTPGFSLTLRDALVQMIICSDNVCTGLLGELMPAEEFQDFCRQAGMVGTVINHAVPPRHMPVEADFDFVAQTTPDDQVLLMGMILDGSTDPAVAARMGVTPGLCRFALEVMGWQTLRGSIPFFLPQGTKVANKTGTGRHGKMDVGLVYRDGRPLFILAAYTHGVPAAMPNGMPGHSVAAMTIARIARVAWDGIP